MQNNQLLRSQSCLPGRKLPAVPTKIPSQNSKKHNVKQQFLLQEYSILQEYLLVARAKLNGLYVIPSGETSLKWYGVLFVKTGHYKGGVFQFSLTLPPSFPSDQPPVIFFETSIYHPSIHPDTNQFEIGSSFKPWSSTHRLWQLLSSLKRSFSIIDTEEVLNSRAAIDYKQGIVAFKQKVEESISKCHERVDACMEAGVGKETEVCPEASDPHKLSFKALDDETYQKLKSQVLQTAKEEVKEMMAEP